MTGAAGMFVWRRDPTDGVGVAFTGRGDGSFSFGNCDDDVVRANLATLRATLGLSRVVVTRQVHGADVLVVDDSPDQTPDSQPLVLATADALVTSAAGVGLGMRVADCVPVALADAQARVVGVAHAGRVGLLAGVLPATVAAMAALGARASRMRAWIGPHVCGDCYEVPADMARQAEDAMPGIAARTSWGTPSLDLGRAAAVQLAGLGLARVERHDPCTMTSPDLFSHRGDGPTTGRQLGLVWLAG